VGKVKQTLLRIELPDREVHNGRMFIDLCENIHIHFRELRIVFSLDEFFEFCDILKTSELDVRNYLAQNPGYREREHSDTVMVAGGKERQQTGLRNSPEPHVSTYFPRDFAIELQDESVIDEIHVHWRDYRLSLPREHFHLIAEAFRHADENLRHIEAGKAYKRADHPGRIVPPKSVDPSGGIQGVTRLSTASIGSRYSDIVHDWNYDRGWVSALVRDIQEGKALFPILVSTEPDGRHLVIDGNHRLCAATIAGLDEVPCIVADLTFDASADFRQAEALLKRFDAATQGRFNAASFDRDWAAQRLNRYYRGHYEAIRRQHGILGKAVAKSKSVLRRLGVTRARLRTIAGVFSSQKQ
jgi:hypothetical protein